VVVSGDRRRRRRRRRVESGSWSWARAAARARFVTNSNDLSSCAERGAWSVTSRDPRPN
jgi:hypothetical protein